MPEKIQQNEKTNKEPRVHSPPEKKKVEKPDEPKQGNEELSETDILDSEGHRVRLNRHPRNPWQQ